jgi:uncharacterized membrane protein
MTIFEVLRRRRYVLAFGLAGVIIAFLIIGLYFYGV